jgi:hypothetical protein
LDRKNRTHLIIDNSGHEHARFKLPPGFFETMIDWPTTQLRRRAGLGWSEAEPHVRGAFI